MRPRSLSARLFVSIAGVSIVAFALGVWLVDRALRLEVKEEITITQPAGGAVVHEDRRREVTEAPITTRGPGLGQRLFIVLSIVLIGSAGATAWLARRIVRPVAALHEASEQMARGDHGVRVLVRGQDEVAALGRAFNAMADQIASDERQRRDLTNDIAHELGTPLTSIRCHLEALADGVTEFTIENANTLLIDVGHLQRVVEDLADLSRADAGQLALIISAVPLSPTLDALAMEIGPRLASARITLVTDVAPSLPSLRADPTRLVQVLRNIVDNAITHTPAGGSIRVGAAARNDVVEITVSDTGTGIAPDHLDRIFERFYRTDPSRARARGGAGLGLAIVQQIVRLHGGDVRAENVPGGGASFVVYWPSSQDLHN